MKLKVIQRSPLFIVEYETKDTYTHLSEKSESINSLARFLSLKRQKDSLRIAHNTTLFLKQLIIV